MWKKILGFQAKVVAKLQYLFSTRLDYFNVISLLFIIQDKYSPESMTPERFKRISAVLNRRQPDLTVVTDEVHKGRNLSAIIRTCDAVGVDSIHAVMPAEGYQVFNGTSASADKWVEVNHHSDVREPVQQLRQQGYQMVAASLSASAVPFRAVDYTRPTALVLGAEVKGLSEYTIANVDHHVTLPMMGMVESLNVSVACALILNEAQRQREAKGMYDRRRLSDEVFRARFFQWAHPAIAIYCDEKGIDYPDVREDGELVAPSEWYRRVREHSTNN